MSPAMTQGLKVSEGKKRWLSCPMPVRKSGVGSGVSLGDMKQILKFCGLERVLPFSDNFVG
jgi:hypothetical protein